MLTLRRIPNICRYIPSFTTYQYRYKSDKSSNDGKFGRNPKTISEELLNFERKDIKKFRDILKNNKEYLASHSKRDKKQMINREKASSKDDDSDDDDKKDEKRIREKFNQRKEPNENLNLAKPFDTNQRKQKRENENNEKIPKKIHPNVILDTESNEVKILTRKVADSLAPQNSSNESQNIEQELLDVLRGHRVVSKTLRRIDKRPDLDPEQSRVKKSRRTQTDPESDSGSNRKEAQTTEAFSSLLRDIKLNSAQSSAKATLEEDFIRDTIDGAAVRPRSIDDRQSMRDINEPRKSVRDIKRRQEYMKVQQLWSGETLGIFSKNDIEDFPVKMSPIWQKYEEEELKRISTIPPRNAFEEMIQWTKDGILWKFPIDNEQDIGKEADVPFHEHVLLERHLHDFPKSPLIRQFMELVCIGLGRNPYWTVEQKLEHINWFRKYFNEKVNVFNETVHTGAIKASAPPPTPKPASTYKPKAPAATTTTPPKVVPAATPSTVKGTTASKN